MSLLREAVLPALPRRLSDELTSLGRSYPQLEEKISELRLRACRLSSLTLEGKNLQLSTVLTEGEMADALCAYCRGSVYAYTESMKRGYLTLGGGCRVGLAGRGVIEDGRIVGLSEISSMSIRIPRRVPGAEEAAYRLFRRLGGKSGILIYAPPGVGKTTVLRELALRLSSGKGAMRVALVDSRGELDAGQLSRGCLVDILRDHPKASGIEIAARTLSPEVILCDEIGSREDVEAILAVQAAGVPLIATAHADSLASLRREAGLPRLFSAGVFGAALGIMRDREGVYHYTETVTHADDESLCVL